MTITTTTEILQIDLKAIVPDPGNTRKKLRNIDELAASIALHGVQTPITVRPWGTVNEGGVEENRYIIVVGHRRHAASLKAGLTTMPAMLDTTERDDRVWGMHRLIENLQRDDLSATEFAQGVQQLFDLGATEADIAAGLSINADLVQAGSRIAKAPKAAAIVDKYELSFDQALAIAEFEDDNDVLKELTVLAQRDPGYFDQKVERYRQQRIRTQAIAALIQELTDKGIAIVSQKARDDGTALGLDRLMDKPKGKRLTKASHRKCPGACVFVTYNGEEAVAMDYCNDWRKNGHVDSWASSSSSSSASDSLSEKAQAAATLKRRTHRAAIEAGKAAQVVRRRFVAELLTRKSAPKGMLLFATQQLLGGRIEDQGSTFHELTGGPGGNQFTHATHAVQLEYLNGKTEAQLPLALFARVAAHIEAQWEPNTWDSDYRKEQRVAYLTLLVSLGYTPSLVEGTVIGKAKPAEVLAEAEALKALRKATPVTKSPAEPVKRAPAKKAVARRRAPARRSR